MLACSHDDLLNGSILYIQNDLEESSDHFEFVLYDMKNVLQSRRVEIVVKPRLNRQKTVLRVTGPQPVTVGLDLLDASQLKVVIIKSCARGRHNMPPTPAS